MQNFSVMCFIVAFYPFLLFKQTENLILMGNAYICATGLQHCYAQF